MTRYTRSAMVMLLDMAIVAASYYLAHLLRLDILDRSWGPHAEGFHKTLLLLLGIRFLCGLLVGQYNWSFRHASLPEAASLVKAVLAGSAIFLGICHFGKLVASGPPRSVYALEFMMTLMGMGFIRFFPRYAMQQYIRRTSRLAPNGETRLRTLILGAGHTGELVLRDMLLTRIYPYEVVGFVDDDPAKWNISIHSRRVLGSSQDLPELIRKHRIDKILVAAPAIRPARLRRIVDLCGSYHVKFKIVPSYAELVAKGAAGPLTLKDVQLEDLLDRATVEFDHARMAEFFLGKTVLVTGAAGSIGSELCRQLIRRGVGRLVALDLDENNLYMLNMELEDLNAPAEIRLEIASVRDRSRIGAIYAKYRPQIVFHAAAHKHVPLMEHCPAEALKNNVLGTLNVAQCACESGCEKFVLISTDKAIRPTSVMGASKHLAETIVRALNEEGRTRFVSVRFGNVLGSSGSLVPILQRQIAKGGPVTITHPKITRFFMTIQEAVGLVLVAAAQNERATCVLDMGEPVNIDSLAREMIALCGLIPESDVKIVYTGLRPGEKMHEELFDPDEEIMSPSPHPKIRIATLIAEPRDTRQMLSALEAVLADGTDGAVREFLLRSVPSYSPPASAAPEAASLL